MDLVVASEVIGELRSMKEHVKFSDTATDDAKVGKTIDQLHRNVLK